MHISAKRKVPSTDRDAVGLVLPQRRIDFLVEHRLRVVVDARAALAKGDRHLLSLGGFVSSTPGIADPSSYSTQELPATTDTEVGQCGREQGMAEAYAARYNRAIVQAGRR